MSAKPSFFAELKRRNVYKVGAMYAVAGWLLVQIVTQVFPVFHVSDVAQRIMVLAVLAGFPAALVLAWLFDITPQGIVRTADAQAGGESPAAVHERRSMERKLNYILGTLLLLGAAYIVLDHTLLRGRSPAAAAGDKSIAVLPFENLSDDKANAYFASGIQDEILTRLAGVGDLKVISRTSTEKYKSKPDNLKTVAADLSVDSVLEGSVQKAGDRIRVNVQLIDARADTHLWASTYDRDLKDVFAVESEVSQSIVDALKAKLSPTETQALAAIPTHDSQAYDLFLKGEYERNQAAAAQSDTTLFDGAADYYRRAIAIDPAFALAHSMLAYTRLYTHWFNKPLSAAGLEEVKATIDRALTLQPNLPEAHEALGLYYYWGLRDYDSAAAEFQRTLALKPNSAEMHFNLAAIYRRIGKWEQSLAELDQAVRLAPRDADMAAQQGTTYTLLRRYDEAERVLTHALTISQDSMQARRFLSTTIINASGDVERARHVFDAVPPSRMVPTARIWGDIGLIDQRIYLDVLQRRFGEALSAWNRAPHDTSSEQLRQLLGLVTVHLLAGQRAEAQATCAQLRAYP